MRIFLLTSLIACQTTPEVYLPEGLASRFFANCPLAGTVSYKLFHRSDYLVAGFIDWDDELGLDVTDTFGNTLASLRRYRRTSIDIAGRHITLAVDHRGRIEVDERYSGLHIDELSCLLAGRLPTNWQQATITERPTTYALVIDDDERLVTVYLGFRGFRVDVKINCWWLFTCAGPTASIKTNSRKARFHKFELQWQMNEE